jgi:beta-galactosidase
LGIGNASCGPISLPQYYIPASPAGISFSIRPYATMDGAADEYARYMVK